MRKAKWFVVGADGSIGLIGLSVAIILIIVILSANCARNPTCRVRICAPRDDPAE